MVMPRVFVCLAIGNLIVLAATAAVGLAQERASADMHVALAVFSLLVSCFVQVAAVMYVNVSGRAVTQAIHLGKLDTSPVERLRVTRRSMVHALALVVAGVVAATATGAVHWQSGGRLAWHLAASGALFLLHLAAFYREFNLIVGHAALVSQVMASYAEHTSRRRVASPPKG